MYNIYLLTVDNFRVLNNLHW